MTKLQLLNLHQAVVNTFPSINISDSKNLKKFLIARVTSIKSVKQESLRE